MAPPPREGPPVAAPAPAPLPAVRPPPWLIEVAAGHTGPPVPLRGTPRQIAWAERLRSSRLAFCRRRAPELVGILSTITDATWWIANGESGLGDLKWPSPDQTRQAPPPAAEAEEFDEFDAKRTPD
jgi:hypothetical protein